MVTTCIQNISDLGCKNQELNKALNLTYQMHALLINRGEVPMLYTQLEPAKLKPAP